MQLYSILKKNQVGVNGIDVSLAAAAQKRGLPYEHIVVEDTILQDVPGLPLAPDALVYRIAANSSKASAIESALVYLHPSTVTTIYAPKTVPLAHGYLELDEQIAAGLPIVPTQIIDETWRKFSDSELLGRIQALDGLPIIVKTLGASHGQGVRRAGTLEEVRSAIEEGLATGHTLLLRKYLADHRNFRLIVVDGAVIAALEYHLPADDFRTNAAKNLLFTPLALEELDPGMLAMAVQSVELRKSLLGGIDVLIDQATGVAYFAEVNIPCNYARAEQPTGVDISGALLDAMIRQAPSSSVKP